MRHIAALSLCIFNIGYLLTCSNSSSVELRKNLEGRWIEEYGCKNNECNSELDSMQTAEIVFAEKTFSNVLYKGAGNNSVHDTSFSGKYYVSKDTIEFILDRFKEVFYYKEKDNTLYLAAAYSIDYKGNKIGDFHSIFWCCSLKKTGKFNRN